MKQLFQSRLLDMRLFIANSALRASLAIYHLRGGRNRIGRREKWPKKSWEEGEIGGKSREEGEKEKLGVGRIEPDGPG